MKKKVLALASVGICAITVLSSYQTGTHGTLGNRTQSTGSSIGCFNCHGNQNNSTTVSVTLMDGSTAVTEYIPGKTYTVILNGGNPNSTQSKYGFQLTCAKTGGTSVGTFSPNGATGVAARANNTFLEHNTPLSGVVAGSGYTYGGQLFQWTAPAAGTGTVKFYAVLNAVNNNQNSDAGDQWNFGSSGNITEGASTGINDARQIKGVQLFPNPSAAEVTVQIENTNPGVYSFQVMDMTGRVLHTEQSLLGSGTNKYKTDISTLTSGIYLMKVVNGTGETLMKFHKL